MGVGGTGRYLQDLMARSLPLAASSAILDAKWESSSK